MLCFVFVVAVYETCFNSHILQFGVTKDSVKRISTVCAGQVKIEGE